MKCVQIEMSIQPVLLVPGEMSVERIILEAGIVLARAP
jgi:hypothetical protein